MAKFIGFFLFLRPADEPKYAEQHEIGFHLEGRFIPKRIARDFSTVCIPSAIEDEMDGFVTHVSIIMYILAYDF